MMRDMMVKIVKNDTEQIFENVTGVRRDDKSIVIEKPDDEIEIENCYVSEVRKTQISVEVGNWIRYVNTETECIETGKVTQINGDEIIVKTLPDGFQVAIHRDQIC